MARTPTPLDYNEIEKLASIYCTEAEIAVFIGFTEEGFRKRKMRDDELVAAIDRGRTNGKASLRKTQFRMALGGKLDGIEKIAPPNVTMLIWLGKQLLGQTDRIEQEVTHNGSVGYSVDEAAAEFDRRIDELAAKREKRSGREDEARG